MVIWEKRGIWRKLEMKIGGCIIVAIQFLDVCEFFTLKFAFWNYLIYGWNILINMHTAILRRLTITRRIQRNSMLASKFYNIRCFASMTRSAQITSYRGLRELYKYNIPAVMSKEWYQYVYIL